MEIYSEKSENFFMLEMKIYNNGIVYFLCKKCEEYCVIKMGETRKIHLVTIFERTGRNLLN